MKFYWLNLLLLALLSFGANAASDGAALYAKHCAVCHGASGKGGVGVPLSLPSFINSVSDEYLKTTIRLGRPGRVMPAFKQLSNRDINAIVGYMRSWSNKAAASYDAKPVKGDKVHGQQLFSKHCVQCHGENAKGGKGTGVTFSRKRDLPIIAPALNNSGFLAAATDNMIKDTIMFGREGTPMTSLLVDGLSEEDVNDVVSYIRSFESIHTENDANDEDAVIVVDSPYGFDETIENLKQAITDQNFTLIRTQPYEHGLVPEGKENKKQVVLHFCNFDFLFKALAIDPRVGMFLPCRATVVERDGKVQIMTINPMRLSRLFNNDELNEACKQMGGIYTEILEDATL